MLAYTDAPPLTIKVLINPSKAENALNTPTLPNITA
jgi:hypothetical protein